MPTLTVPILHAFSDGDEGGNPAGVVLDAERLTPAERQQIAAQIGLSETAFVSASDMADFRLEFYTPTRQIIDCGHATVAAFSLLSQRGLLSGPHSAKQLADGSVRAIALMEGRVFMEQPVPQYMTLDGSGVTIAEVLASLGLTVADLQPGPPPMIAQTSGRGLFIPVRDANTLRRLTPDMPAIHAISDTLALVEYYVFSLETHVAGRDAGARMFAPRYGIPEESATGIAAGPLACLLRDHFGVHKSRLIIEQGRFMTPPAPSELVVDLTLTDDGITAVQVGGRAYLTTPVHLVW
jgi:PhzF family phenazine biosynthesis protein